MRSLGMPSDKSVGIEVTLEKKPFMDVIAEALPSFREWQTDNLVPLLTGRERLGDFSGALGGPQHEPQQQARAFRPER